MKSLPIPMATVEAYGAVPVKIDPPKNFELNNGQEVESLYGMKIDEVVYILMGIEEGEREALARTNCFYIGFLSGVIPVFNLRVADIIHGKTDSPTEPLPILFTDYQLAQEARDSWPHVTSNVVYKLIEAKTELRGENSPDSRIIEAGDYLFHDFSDGATFVIDASFAKALINGSEETRNNTELLESIRDGNSEEE